MELSDIFRIPQGEMRTLLDTGVYTVETDERTLWVNGAAMLGRFSPMGVDVHTDGECVGCKTGDPDFEAFAVAMLREHNIDVTPFRSERPWLPRIV